MPAPADARAILHVAPHPDDELIGAPATVMALRDAGHPVVNLACSLGRPADHARRREELTEACARAGFELVIPDGLPALGSEDDLPAAQAELTDLIATLIQARACAYVVSPSPHDGHPAHETVGRAVRDALTRLEDPAAWGMWGLWSELPLPNLYVPFDEPRLAEIEHALRAHAGEIDRNDYASLIGIRGRMNAILGAERVFGFGAAYDGTRYAELLTEVVFDGDRFQRTPPARRPRAHLAGVPAGSTPLDRWLYRTSDRDALPLT